jgi:ribonucleoside-diphosphate reductase alpha chain
MSKKKLNYSQLSEERKQLQSEGLIPDWYSTAGWQLFKDRYLYKAKNVKEQFTRIANTAASHLPENIRQLASTKFFNMLWDGVLSGATPVVGNTGTDRGLPVSCQGADFGDSIYNFYKTKLDLAIHTQEGFGTSGYLGDVRPRGSKISRGGTAEGVLPLLKGMVSDMQYISQGSVRRGSFAGYLPLSHGDFDEVIEYIHSNPEDFNIGWNISNEEVDKLCNNSDIELNRRFSKAMARLKMSKGKGYWMFPDKANNLTTQAIKNSGKKIKASNLC